MLKPYVAKPVEIQAVRLTRENAEEMRKFIGENNYDANRNKFDPYNILLRNKHGDVQLNVGDWLVKEADGSGYYPCDDVTFSAKYKPKV